MEVTNAWKAAKCLKPLVYSSMGVKEFAHRVAGAMLRHAERGEGGGGEDEAGGGDAHPRRADRGADLTAEVRLVCCVCVCPTDFERWSVRVLTMLGCSAYVQVMRRAATSHPMKMLECNSGGPRCSMCKLVAADPVYKNMVPMGKVSRARFCWTICKTCICSRNPLCYLKHTQGGC